MIYSRYQVLISTLIGVKLLGVGTCPIWSPHLCTVSANGRYPKDCRISLATFFKVFGKKIKTLTPLREDGFQKTLSFIDCSAKKSWVIISGVGVG